MTVGAYIDQVTGVYLWGRCGAREGNGGWLRLALTAFTCFTLMRCCRECREGRGSVVVVLDTT